jgi:hypothetical protein
MNLPTYMHVANRRCSCKPSHRVSTSNCTSLVSYEARYHAGASQSDYALMPNKSCVLVEGTRTLTRFRQCTVIFRTILDNHPFRKTNS